MYSRSEIRHACFRAKNKSLTPKNEEVLSKVKPLLAAHQRFDNFTDEWDILLDSSGKIVIIKPEVDIEFIRSTCLEKQFQIKYNVKEELTPRKQNVVVIVEAAMLEGKMTWDNFDKAWGVSVDVQFKTINTNLFVKSSQTAVTEEMIQASKVSDDSTAHSGKSEGVVELTLEKVTPDKVKPFLPNAIIKAIK